MISFPPSFRCLQHPAIESLLPPYRDFHSLPRDLSDSSGRLPDGLVLSVRLDRLTRGDGLATVLTQLAAALPIVPRVVRLTPATELAGLTKAFRGGFFPAHGLLLDGQIPADELRAVLAAPNRVPGVADDWLRFRHRRLSPNLRFLLTRIFQEAAQANAVSDVLRRVGVAETTMRAKLSKHGLPTARQWLCVARALHGAIRLQAEPSRPLASVAYEMGYAEQSSLSNVIHRCFGVRPSFVRGTVGASWLIDRWREGSDWNRPSRMLSCAG